MNLLQVIPLIRGAGLLESDSDSDPGHSLDDADKLSLAAATMFETGTGFEEEEDDEEATEVEDLGTALTEVNLDDGTASVGGFSVDGSEDEAEWEETHGDRLNTLLLGEEDESEDFKRTMWKPSEHETIVEARNRRDGFRSMVKRSVQPFADIQIPAGGEMVDPHPGTLVTMTPELIFMYLESSIEGEGFKGFFRASSKLRTDWPHRHVPKYQYLTKGKYFRCTDHVKQFQVKWARPQFMKITRDTKCEIQGEIFSFVEDTIVVATGSSILNIDFTGLISPGMLTKVQIPAFRGRRTVKLRNTRSEVVTKKLPVHAKLDFSGTQWNLASFFELTKKSALPVAKILTSEQEGAESKQSTEEGHAGGDRRRDDREKPQERGRSRERMRLGQRDQRQESGQGSSHAPPSDSSTKMKKPAPPIPNPQVQVQRGRRPDPEDEDTIHIEGASAQEDDSGLTTERAPGGCDSGSCSDEHKKKSKSGTEPASLLTRVGSFVRISSRSLSRLSRSRSRSRNRRQK